MCHSVDYSCFENWRHDRQAEWMEKVVRSTQFTFASTISRHILLLLIYTTRDQCSAETGEKIVTGKVLTRGRTKICFRPLLPQGKRLCPSEWRSGICDFYLLKRYGHPRLWDGLFAVTWKQPLCSPSIVWDHKKQAYVVPVKPKLSRNTFRFLGKRIMGIKSSVIHWTASLRGGIVRIKTPVIHLTVSLRRCIVRIKPRHWYIEQILRH